MRKIRVAFLLAIAALAIGLVGWGVNAAFTDGGSATANIKVGTFGITVTSTQQGAVVVNSGTTHTVTLSMAEVLGSAAGTSPLAFTVTSTGDIPVKAHVTQSVPNSPFTSLLPDPIADQVLAQGQHADFVGGLQWPDLVNADLGKSASIVYTISALEQSATYLPQIGTFTRVGNTLTIRVNSVDGTPILPGDTLSTYNMGAVYGTPGWSDGLATADASGVIYYTGTGFNGSAVQASTGNCQITVKRGGSIMKSFAAHL